MKTCKYSCINNFAFLFLDFQEIFTKEIENDIHHFGKFLLIFDLERDRYWAPNQA